MAETKSTEINPDDVVNTIKRTTRIIVAPKEELRHTSTKGSLVVFIPKKGRGAVKDEDKGPWFILSMKSKKPKGFLKESSQFLIKAGAECSEPFCVLVLEF